MKSIQELYANNQEFRESRLKSLFSDYSSLKESNPEGYHANLNVWKHFLTVLFESQSALTFDYTTLFNELKYRSATKVYTPEGLYIAINSMLNDDKNIIFLSEVKTIGEAGKSKSYGILGTLSWILFGTRHVDIRNTNHKNQQLVFIPKLENYSKKVKIYLASLLKEGPINLVHLQRVLRDNNIEISNEDLRYVLFYSINDFNISFENDVIFSSSVPVSKEDETTNIEDLKHITDLNYTIYKLQQYNNGKVKEITELDAQIKQSIKDKNQITARSQLKLKKMLEAQLQKTLISLENLHTMKIKVEDAHNNLLISNVWKDNSKMLKLLNGRTSKTNLDDIFDELYEEIENTDSISGKLGNPVDQKYDDEEIENELLQLETSVRKEEEEEEKEGNSNLETEVDNVRMKLDSLKIPQTKPQKEKNTKEENTDMETRIVLPS